MGEKAERTELSFRHVHGKRPVADFRIINMGVQCEDKSRYREFCLSQFNVVMTYPRGLNKLKCRHSGCTYGGTDTPIGMTVHLWKHHTEDIDASTEQTGRKVGLLMEEKVNSFLLCF